MSSLFHLLATPSPDSQTLVDVNNTTAVMHPNYSFFLTSLSVLKLKSYFSHPYIPLPSSKRAEQIVLEFWMDGENGRTGIWANDRKK